MNEPCCGNCNAWKFVGQNGEQKMGACRATPGTPIMVGVAQTRLAGPGGQSGQAPVVHAYHPSKSSDDWCRQWQPQLQKLPAEPFDASRIAFPPWSSRGGPEI